MTADEPRVRVTTKCRLREAQLDPAVFVRIHRRYVLNLARLARIEMGVSDSRIAVLNDGTQLPISRTGYGKLRELL